MDGYRNLDVTDYELNKIILREPTKEDLIKDMDDKWK